MAAAEVAAAVVAGVGMEAQEETDSRQVRAARMELRGSTGGPAQMPRQEP